LNSSDVTARINLGSVLLFRKKPLEAEGQFRAALEYDPESAPAHLGAAMTAIQLGRRADAQAQLKEALRIQPGYPEALALAKQFETVVTPK
jgi:Tfp pilus assembly protein PilF